MKLHQILEIIGLLLILTSVGWELFFGMTLDSIEKSIQSMRLDDKLDQLYHRQLELQKHFDLKILPRNSEVPGYPLSEKWNPSTHDEKLPGVARQAENFRRVKIVLFVIGSFLLILAKGVEYSSRPLEIKPCVPTPNVSQPH